MSEPDSMGIFADVEEGGLEFPREITIKKGAIMDVVFGNLNGNQKEVMQASSVGFDLKKGEVYVWGDDGERVVLDVNQTDFCLALPEEEGGEINE